MAAATDSVHVAIEVLTFYPDVARRVFADGNMLASLFSQFSISIDPTSVTVGSRREGGGRRLVTLDVMPVAPCNLQVQLAQFILYNPRTVTAAPCAADL